MNAAAQQNVAAALAGSFLAGEWTRAGLLRRGASTLGGRRRWLARLVTEVLTSYRDPPQDRPRELARLIRATAAFEAAVVAARRPLRAPVRLVVATTMTPLRWPVAPLDSVADLTVLLELDPGRLSWYADPGGMQRRAGSPALHLYRYRWLARPGRTPRLLEIPRARLARAQRTVLDRVLAPVPCHPAAHGFVVGRSARTGAALHVGSDVVLSLDLAGFFATVTAPRIYGLLRTAGYPEAVAHLLTGLCTTAAPVRVLAGMPPGGNAEDRYRLRRALAATHLPQGAPSSPQLANLSAYRLDCRLAGLAAATSATYTRYADDLALSGGPDLTRRAARVVSAVRRIVEDEGFGLNAAKTRVQPRAGRQTVTGIVVNDRLNATRPEYERLRATLHNAARTGPAGQNRDGHVDFRSHLLGRMGWVESLNPGRGRRLRAAFDRIDWSG